MNHTDDFANPLNAWSSEMLAHSIIMTVTLLGVLPFGVAAARIGSPSHKYIQAGVFVLLVIGVVIVMSTGPPVSVKRHADAVAGAHAHAHAFVGLSAVVIMFASGLLALVGRDSDDVRNTTRAIHHGLGWLLCIAFLFQLITGPIALFALESLSGFDQVVGHFAPALALIGVALLTLMRRRWTSERRERIALFFESLLLYMGGLMICVYSLLSEWPYDGLVHIQHAIIGIALTIIGVLSMRANDRYPTAARRGLLSSVPAALVAGVIMCAHPQHNAYSTAFHRQFGALLLLAGCVRVARLWRAYAALLVVAACVFVASQHGAARLYTRYYTESVGIETLLVIMVLVGLTLFAYLLLVERKWHETTLARSKSVEDRVREIDQMN